MIAFDGKLDFGGARGLDRAATFDRASFGSNRGTMDSTGVFFVNELERMDQTLHEPQVNITWQRDIDLREDVTVGDDSSSFTISTYGSPGGLQSNGINWMSKDADAVTGPSVDIGKVSNPLIPWGTEVRYTQFEVESSKTAGRPIDAQKYSAMQLKHQMDIDQMVYIGDSTYGAGYTGMANSGLVTAGFAAVGASGSTLWANKTPQEILADIDAVCVNSWVATGGAVFPDRVLIPFAQEAYIASQLISAAGSASILSFVLANSLCNRRNGRPLDIQSTKWMTGIGVGGTQGVSGTVDRMAAYTRNLNFVRYPMTGMVRTPVQYRSQFIATTYMCKLGIMEEVYPENSFYLDGI